jgi:hypothetical protein
MIEQSITTQQELSLVIKDHPELKSDRSLAECDMISVEKITKTSNDSLFTIFDKRNGYIFQTNGVYLIKQDDKYILDYKTEDYN